MHVVRRESNGWKSIPTLALHLFIVSLCPFNNYPIALWIHALATNPSVLPIYIIGQVVSSMIRNSKMVKLVD